eukprot:5354678-Prymnesium_polylepis.2
MTLDHAQQDLRKRMGKVLALHQSEQKLEKRERDVAAREVRRATAARRASDGRGVGEAPQRAQGARAAG